MKIDSKTYNSFQQSWESYANKCTIGSVGLCDGNRMMFEYYALFAKYGSF